MIVILNITTRPGADETLIAEQCAQRAYGLDTVTDCELMAEPVPTDATAAARYVGELRRLIYGNDPTHRGNKMLLDAQAACLHQAGLALWHRRFERALYLVGKEQNMSRGQVLGWLDDWTGMEPL